MQEIKALIEKFWAGTATEVEKKRLFEWMNSNGGEWQQLLEKEYGSGVMGKLRAVQQGQLHGRSEETLEKLHRQIEEWESGKLGAGEGLAGRGKIAWLIRRTRWVAAAVILIGVGFGIFRYVSLKNRPADVVSSEIKNTGRSRQEVNRGTTVQRILLQDGSVVDLYPGSEVTYQEPFDTTRELTVNGKALFKVAGNPRVPFIVYAKGFATRVLGTEFIVNTQTAQRVSVLLLKGKVSVHAMPGSGVAMKDIYLAPGQLLAVDLESKNYAVEKWAAADTGLAGNVVRKSTERPAIGYACIFNKTPLPEVFRQLSQHYKTHILFDKQDLEGQSFTGKILKTDQLQVALSVICNTNDLTFRTENGNIIINK